MDAILVRERYKIICVLRSQADYVCAEAVDILDREKREWLLNIYEGPLLRMYLPCFDRMHGCASFHGMFLEGESLVTVFEQCRGTTIDQVFYRGDHYDWQTRLDCAEQLFGQALNMADLPPEIACPAMLSENVFWEIRERSCRLRFLIAPMEGANDRELVFLTCDQVKKILRPQFSSPDELLDFLEELERGCCGNIVQLYALWRVWQDRIKEGYESLDRKNFFWRFITLVWKHIKRWVVHRKRR